LARLPVCWLDFSEEVNNMTVTPADFSPITDQIVGTMTSTAALLAYGAVALVGVGIGTVVKAGPKLFRFLWKFIP
jgi:hypothetical protein